MDAVTPVDLPVRVPLATEPMGVLASLRAARRNVLEIIPELATRQPMVSGKTAIRWHMVMDPGAARRVLKERLDDYPKSDVTKNILEPAIGQSLFIAEGAHWRWQRRAAAPVFGTRNVNSLAPIMARAAEASVARLDAQSGRAADLFQEMLATTFEVIADVTFSEGSSVDRDAVHRAIEEYIAKIGPHLAARRAGRAHLGAATQPAVSAPGHQADTPDGRSGDRGAPGPGRAVPARSAWT
jgi:cytochrome P450